VVKEGDQTHIHLAGIVTFLGIPKISSALEHVKPEGVVHLHSKGLRYIDHACIEIIEAWVERREELGQQVHVEMEKLHLRYRTRLRESVG
jgi:MFS superfamily sulfate permease-like transporter